MDMILKLDQKIMRRRLGRDWRARALGIRTVYDLFGILSAKSDGTKRGVFEKRSCQ